MPFIRIIIIQTMRSKERKTYRPLQDKTSTPISPNVHPKPRFSTEREEHSRSKNNLKLLNNNQQYPTYQSQQLQMLVKQNNELKKQLIELKVNQFYHFDDKKLKQLIAEVQDLKKELKKTKSQIAELQLQNDFLTRTNAQLKLQLQKQIQLRKKQSFNDDYKVSLKNVSCKANDYTRNTDTSRNTQDELYSVYLSTNFQNTTLQEVFDYKDTHKNRQSLGLLHTDHSEGKTNRRNILNKILSPRKGGKETGMQVGNQYLLLRKKKEKSPTLIRKN